MEGVEIKVAQGVSSEEEDKYRVGWLGRCGGALEGASVAGKAWQGFCPFGSSMKF